MALIERRSGSDLRSEIEQQLIGERRAGIERRYRLASPGEIPSNDHLAMFARRLKRAMRDPNGRGFFGVVSGEDHFTVHNDVSRLLDWIERIAEPDIKVAQSASGTV
jgi:hypothetical protein